MGKMKLFATLIVATVAMAAASNAGAQRQYYDALVFDLRGNVKKCSIDNSVDSNMDNVYYFDSDGSFTGNSVTVVRGDNGLPVEISRMDSSLGLFAMLAGEGKMVTAKYSYADLRGKGNWAMSVGAQKSEGPSLFLYYGNDGYAKEARKSVFIDEDPGFRITFLYYELSDFDSHGNWTRRSVYESTEENGTKRHIYDETREIEYWDDGSPDISLVNYMFKGNKIVEPSRELTITDMMYRPLGFLDAPGNNLWNLPFQSVKEEVERRSNWELHNTGYLYMLIVDNGTVYTYRNEPVSIDTDITYRGDLDYYSYGFTRNIKGKMPKHRKWEKEEWLRKPQWTKEEAIAFAEALVADLKSAGLTMVKGKNLKHDIFTMVGQDNQSFYKVRVFRNSDDYSAFFTVSLYVYPVDSRSNTLRNH